ncbi:DUF2243 domain-containing protein [Paracoccus sp. (in: a-proteobacteria)]|uniref:DUF2243 domain-containing protein n=1 Tax=Paracoccus sp. TaxID=267 RepID=UPI00396CF3F1
MAAGRVIGPGIVLGIGLGGFFDGILLHQILQWHHLLSLVPGMTDIRSQILWDGLFHGLMYVLAAVGLFGLWRAHRGTQPLRGRALAASVLIGFGLWHILDNVLSHWLLGIHRIRDDSPNPLLWDLIWLAAFGIVPILLAVTLLRGQDNGSGSAHAGRMTLLLGVLTIGTGAWALRTPPDMPLSAVIFRASTTAEQVEASLAATGARIVWADPAAGVALLQVPRRNSWAFYRHGALMVTGSGMPPGCFAFSRLHA